MSEDKKQKAKPKVTPQKTAYEYIMSKTIENVLSTMQMYTAELHAKILNRALLSLECKAVLRLNPFQITDAEEKMALELLASDPVRATQAALNYGFNFHRHTTSDLGWNLGLGVLLLGVLR